MAAIKINFYFCNVKIYERYTAAAISSVFCAINLLIRYIRILVCGSSNAHKDTLIRPEQRHKPFLFNVQKRISTMNAKLYGSTEKERKDHMKKCIDGTCGAIMFYFDDDLNIRCCGTTEEGYEANLLQLLSSASMTARNAVEEVLW